MEYKITLAIICGNVERYIARFLDSFLPLVDEVVIVRAIGALEPDRTFDIAREIAAQVPAKPFILDEYRNAAATADWPHLDDFAAARNKAFSMATHPWVFWADTDDTIDAASIREILSALKKHGDQADAFMMAYDVPDDGLRVDKARLVRKCAAAWRHMIHEELHLLPESPRGVNVTQAFVVHRPAGSRAVNDERNLRMLRRMRELDQITPGHRFHLVSTLDALGHKDEAREEAAALLVENELAAPERFELFMILARLATSESQAGQFYLQAAATDPMRREAFGDLAIFNCKHGQFGSMLGWTRAMLAQPNPEKYLWNHRSQYYGFAGIRLHAMALRLNGRRITADTIQFNHFSANGRKISLLHATRGRSKKALMAQHQWFRKAQDPDAIEHIFALDADDEQALPLAANLSVVLPPGGGCVRAWNAAAAVSTGHVLVQMSDDWDPPLHWDRIILDRLHDAHPGLPLADLPPAVLAVSDGHRTDRLLCMAIMTRARYVAQGFMFHPAFEAAAMFSDNHFTDAAYRDGVVIEARDVTFEHQHPAFDSSVPLDATYAAQNAPEKYQLGREIYDRLRSGQ